MNAIISSEIKSDIFFSYNFVNFTHRFTDTVVEIENNLLQNIK